MAQPRFVPDLDLVAGPLDVEIGHAIAREHAEGVLSPTAVPWYVPVPAVAASETLAALGWTSPPLAGTFARTLNDHLESGGLVSVPTCTSSESTATRRRVSSNSSRPDHESQLNP